MEQTSLHSRLELPSDRRLHSFKQSVKWPQPSVQLESKWHIESVWEEIPPEKLKSFDFTIKTNIFDIVWMDQSLVSHPRHFSNPIRLDNKIGTNLLIEHNEKVWSFCCQIDGDIDGGSARFGVLRAILKQGTGNKDGAYVWKFVSPLKATILNSTYHQSLSLMIDHGHRFDHFSWKMTKTPQKKNGMVLPAERFCPCVGYIRAFLVMSITRPRLHVTDKKTPFFISSHRFFMFITWFSITFCNQVSLTCRNLFPQTPMLK